MGLVSSAQIVPQRGNLRPNSVVWKRSPSLPQAAEGAQLRRIKGFRSTLMPISCPHIGGLAWRRFFVMQTRDLVASVGSGGSRDLAAPTAARVEWLPVVVCGCLG